MKRIVILGAGESGAGAAVLAKVKGFETFVSDMSAIKDKYKDLLDSHHIAWEEGHHTEELILNADEVIKSPGIPNDAPLILKLKAQGTPVISEIEFAGRYTDAKMICITGSNGKTTTTSLIYHIFKSADLNVGLAGNIGKSLALQVAEEHHDYYIIELSSFQLDNMYNFRANIAVLMNITPDHLDRHKTMECYIQVKEGITRNQTEEDTCVLNYEDPVLREFGKTLKCKVLYFSSKEKLDEGIFMDGDFIVYRHDGKNEKVLDVNELNIIGRHNHENVMTAVAIEIHLGVPMDMIREACREFKAVEHRIEYVRERFGVTYYNDSKGTNPDAAIQAIKAMPGPTLLIAGGYDKHSEYDEWIENFDGKVRYLVLIGQTRDKIAECAKKHGITDIMYAEDMQEAVQVCASYANAGDYVLLSPACASWGMFKNFEERGRIFKECVNAL